MNMQAKESSSVKNPTRHKIREAEYFLTMMKQVFEDDDVFSFNLSAFLSAARSITFYMKKQYKRRKGFAEWYSRHQIKMSADPELKYLNDARVEAVKKEPVQTGATRQITLPSDATIIKGDTPKVEQIKGAEPKPTQSSPKTVRRFFPEFKHMDVITFCEKQLAKLIKLVTECEKRFP